MRIAPHSAALLLGVTLLAGCQDSTAPVAAGPVADAHASLASAATMLPISAYLDATRGKCYYEWYQGGLPAAEQIRGYADLTGSQTAPDHYDGFVKEQPGPDNSTLVTVQLRGTDVRAYARNPGSASTLFDSERNELLFRLDFTLPADRQLADLSLCEMFATATRAQLQFSGSGDFGYLSDYAAGTAGMLTMVQTGLFGLPSAAQHGNGVADLFPGDRVTLRPVGM